MTSTVLDPWITLPKEWNMTLAALDPWIALAKEWQPLLAAVVAGLLAVLAAIILARGIVMGAKIRAASLRDNYEKPLPQDLRISRAPSPVGNGPVDIVNANLEKLRSLLRSALSSLSLTDAGDEIPRTLCTRIAAFQWKNFSLPVNADNSMRETYAIFLNQLEMLREALGKEWSSSEVSAILIQLNANARALSGMLKQMHSSTTEAFAHHNKIDGQQRTSS